MNVIIANQYKDALSSLNIDVIKKMDGVFDVDVIIDTFANFYYNRLILDITALKDCFNIATIQKLSASLDASKIILFLSDDPRINNGFLSKIISLGIYNFTHDLSAVTYLMENPNAYRDVAQYHNLAASDNSGMQPSMNNNYNSNNNFFNQNQVMQQPMNQVQIPTTRIIGFKDLTDDAGSTTLIYMLKRHLTGIKNVLAVEIDSNDFSYFNDSELLSTTNSNFNNVKTRFSQFEVVLIDINKANLENECTEIIYLLEPSTIKLNSLMRKDPQALLKIKEQKIVLNKSLLTVSDVKEFEYEAKVKMFYNIPPLDERKDHQMVLDSFLEKLEIFKDANSRGGGLFNLFK